MEEKSSEVVLKDSERQKCEVWTRVMGYHRPLQSFRVPPGFESESLYPNCPPDYPSPDLQARLRSLFPQFAVRR